MKSIFRRNKDEVFSGSFCLCCLYTILLCSMGSFGSTEVFLSEHFANRRSLNRKAADFVAREISPSANWTLNYKDPRSRPVSAIITFSALFLLKTPTAHCKLMNLCCLGNLIKVLLIAGIFVTTLLSVLHYKYIFHFNKGNTIS